MATLLLGEFANRFQWSAVDFGLSENVSSDETGGGAAIRVARGSRLWRGALYHHSGNSALRREIDAMIELLKQPDGNFLFSPPGAFPASDPRGLTIASASPRIAGVTPKTLSLEALPAGYEISVGDFIGWRYASPSRFALHQAVSSVTATGAGLATLDVVPDILSGPDGTLVDFVKPVIRVVVVPDNGIGRTNLPGFSGPRSINFRQVIP